jgi:transcription elongation factor S-II
MSSARKMMIDRLNTISSDVKLIANIEKSVFNYSIRTCKGKKIQLNWNEPKFKKIYMQKCRSIIWNLRNPKNSQFKESMENGTIDVRTLPDMLPWEIFPELYKPIFELKEARERNTLDFTNESNTAETDFQCSKCKSRRCTYYSLQTRSADEPMTNYFTCLNCNAKWKE